MKSNFMTTEAEPIVSVFWLQRPKQLELQGAAKQKLQLTVLQLKLQDSPPMHASRTHHSVLHARTL